MSAEFAQGIKKVFFVVIAILSMATSFLFFVEVFSIGQGIVSSIWLSVVVNGVIGVLVSDLAAIAWLKIYLQASDNNTLRSLAVVGFAVGFVGSAVASLAYLLTVASGYQMTADARIYTQLVMAVVIVAHFALVFLSIYKATSAKIDEKTAKLLSEGTDEMLKLTENYFRDLIPDLAAENATKLAGELKTRFTSMSSLTGQVGKKSKNTNGPDPYKLNGRPSSERPATADDQPPPVPRGAAPGSMWWLLNGEWKLMQPAVPINGNGKKEAWGVELEGEVKAAEQAPNGQPAAPK